MLCCACKQLAEAVPMSGGASLSLNIDDASVMATVTHALYCCDPVNCC